MNVLEYVLEKCKLRHKKDLEEDLKLVINFLPEYPVMAVMEAEALGLGEYFVNILRTSFSVLPLK